MMELGPLLQPSRDLVALGPSSPQHAWTEQAEASYPFLLGPTKRWEMVMPGDRLGDGRSVMGLVPP